MPSEATPVENEEEAITGDGANHNGILTQALANPGGQLWCIDIFKLSSLEERGDYHGSAIGCTSDLGKEL